MSKATETTEEDSEPNDIVKPNNGFQPVAKNQQERRAQLLREYHDGYDSLISKLEKDGSHKISQLQLALIKEMLKETDNLAGSAMICMQDNDVKSSANISEKRIQGLALTSKIVNIKQMFDKESGGFDLTSPYVKVIVKYFFDKIKDTCRSLGYTSDASDVFFRAFGGKIEDYERELQERFDYMNSIGNNDVKKI